MTDKNTLNEHQMQLLGAMSHSHVRNYVWPGLTSSLVGGDGHGSIRLFQNTREQHAEITPHSHRFDFMCQVLRGCVTQTIWHEVKAGVDDGEPYALTSLIYQGKPGAHQRSTARIISNWKYSSCIYTTHQWYSMTSQQIHTIKFSHDAIVLFFEGPTVAGRSAILEPWIDGEVIPTYKVEPWMFLK